MFEIVIKCEYKGVEGVVYSGFGVCYLLFV